MNDAPICLAICDAAKETIVAGFLLFIAFWLGYMFANRNK